MTPRLHRAARLLSLGILMTAGCARFMKPEPPTVAEQWAATLAQVGQEVQDNRYGTADRLLREFQQSHPSSPEAADAMFYRALYRLEPANPATSPREAGVLLESYLSSTIASPRRAEAMVLRHLASTLDARASAVAAVGAPQGGAAPARAEESKAKDDEIARLRDELTKANAELERIKRRVAKPKP